MDLVRNSSYTLALCRYKTSRLATCQRVVLSDGSKAPEWIQLMPAGDVNAFDGRKFKNPSPEKVVELFRKNGLDLPLDWEHASEIVAPKGGKAPAAGWITDLEVRNGEIWAKINWTQEGERSVCSREYRYVSPGFYHDKNGNVVGMSSAGLTNKPALKLAELAREGDDMEPEVLALLGLSAGASAAEVMSAIKAGKGCSCGGNMTAYASLQQEAKTLKDKVAELEGKVKEGETALATARSATPGLDKFVPRSDYDLAVARIAKLEQGNTEALALAHQQQVDNEIEAASKAGKITPATVDYYKKQCATPEGLKLFREFIKVAPAVVEGAILDGREPPGGSDGTKRALTAEEREMCVRMNLTEEEYRAGAL